MTKEKIKRYLERLEQANKREDAHRTAKEGLARLAFGSVADCVLLAFCDEAPSPEALEGLDLFSLSEFKRGKGTVEVKFYDRLKALQALMEAQQEESGGELPLYEALEKSAAALRDRDGLKYEAAVNRDWEEEGKG